jgi:hypothetical protein
MPLWDLADTVRVTGSLSHSNLFCSETTLRVAKWPHSEGHFRGHGIPGVVASIRQRLHYCGGRDVTRPAE